MKTHKQILSAVTNLSKCTIDDFPNGKIEIRQALKAMDKVAQQSQPTKEQILEVFKRHPKVEFIVVDPTYSDIFKVFDELRFCSLPSEDSQVDYKTKYEKCINTIRKFDAGIIGMYDL